MELKIEKLIYGGDGLARLPANESGRGKAAFVPFVLAGERVDASLIEEKPGFVRAKVNKILEASTHRGMPPCPYFTTCGGCHYQHAGYEQQLEIKASILKENLRRLAKLELSTELQIHPSHPWNYRNRTRMRVDTGQGFVLGYNRFGSRQLKAIEECPISSKLINQAISSVWSLGRKGEVHSAIREVEFFSNADDSELLVESYMDGETETEQAAAVAREFHTRIPQAAGVVVLPVLQPHRNSKNDGRTRASAGTTFLEYKTAQEKFRVSAGSFFQTNRYLTDKLVELVTNGSAGQTALDLYAGVGLFSTSLCRQFERVVAVESSPQSSGDLEYNLPGNGKAIKADVESYLARGGKRRPDLIVVDPPRTGLGAKVTAALVELRARRLTYVSCDPATLARDLVPLLSAGYRVEQAHLVDLFPQTFHIETVLHLTRPE